MGKLKEKVACKVRPKLKAIYKGLYEAVERGTEIPLGLDLKKQLEWTGLQVT